MRAVFLVSSCDTCSHDLTREHADHGDIVHTSLADGHRRLGYKILSGYIWTYQHCPHVSYAAKTDDNVVLDMQSLMNSVDNKQYEHNQFVACTSPNRRTKVLRGDHMHMTGMTS